MMNNLTLLQHLNAKILYIKRKIHNKGSYFVMIPFKEIKHSDYLSNFDNGLFVRLTKSMLSNDNILEVMNNIYNKTNASPFIFDNQFWIDPDISIPDNLDPNIKQDPNIDIQVPDNLDPNFGQNSFDVQIPDNLDPNFGQTPNIDVQIPGNLDPNFNQDNNIDVQVPDNLDPNFNQDNNIDVQVPDNLDSNFDQTPNIDVQIPDNLDPSFGQTPNIDIQVPDNLDTNFGQDNNIDVQIPDNLDPNFGQYPNIDIPENLDPGFGYIPGLEILNSLDDSTVMHIMSLNYEHYATLNELIDNDFGGDALINFNTTFMSLFKEFNRYGENDPTDYVEHAVIDFYSNGMWDDATVLMTAIFDTMISTTESSSCGCKNTSNGCGSSTMTSNSINTGTSMVNIDNATCVDKYKAAMFQWLQNMLSDYKFYCKWMTIDTDDDGRIPETSIIDKMILLLNLLLESEYDLSSLGETNKSGCAHRHGKKSDCGDFTDSNGTACTNYSIIKNYIKVLEYVKNDEVLENKNKIYIYGKQFAAILPLLSF